MCKIPLGSGGNRVTTLPPVSCKCFSIKDIVLSVTT
jgi:hypothetical protein